MTTDQAVNRQADHENLVQELAEALRRLLDAADLSDVDPDVLIACALVLVKVQS